MVFQNGDVYEGEFRANKINGMFEVWVRRGDDVPVSDQFKGGFDPKSTNLNLQARARRSSSAATHTSVPGSATRGVGTADAASATETVMRGCGAMTFPRALGSWTCSLGTSRTRGSSSKVRGARGKGMNKSRMECLVRGGRDFGLVECQDSVTPLPLPLTTILQASPLRSPQR